MPTEPALAAVIAPMSGGDIGRGMDLVRMAGWNQTEADWAAMLRLGKGYGIHDRNGRLVASSVILPYPPGIGWIGMVLVDAAARRQGLARRLLDHAIARLRTDGLVPMLDATPAGRELYRKLGFVDVAPINRWRGVGRGAARAAGHDAGPDAAALAAAVAMDADAFGAARAALLADLSSRQGARTLALAAGGGALWSRAGRTATQIGPVVAAGEGEALMLCAMALDHIGGPLLLDVPEREKALAAMLAERGFAIERSFTRMAAGPPSPLLTLGTAMRVIAGPELG